MKICAWNIRQGGSTRIKNIVETIFEHDADIVILTEFRIAKGNLIQSALLEKGWHYQITSNPEPKTNGIMIASKLPFEYEETIVPSVKQRWLEVKMKENGVTLLAVHVPTSGDKWDKRQFWDDVISFAEKRKNDMAIITGDFNTGLPEDAEGTPFVGSEYITLLKQMGWVDAWRLINGVKKEYTWYSNVGNGFRLDYSFITQDIAKKVSDVYHSHSEREMRYSDHSSLTVNFDD